MSKEDKKKSTPDAVRLRRLRKALGYKSGAEFARFLGISKARWWNFENGYPLPREMVFLLCKKIDGLTSDWIYFGREQFLTVDLRDKLRQPNGAPSNGKRQR